MIEKAPILITGIPRSGASTVARIIHSCGAFAGQMSQAERRFENDRIRDTIVKSYLTMSGMDPEGQYPLVTTHDWIPVEFKKRVEKVMLDEGYTGGDWMYKDSRMALMFQVWNYAFPSAKWIIVRRRSGDIIESCLQTGYMKVFKTDKYWKELNVTSERDAWIHMLHYYENQFVRMIQEGLNCKVLWPERMRRGDYRQLYETLDWLGLPWKNDAIDIMNKLIGKEE